MASHFVCQHCRLEVLGNVFNIQGTCSDHIHQRITKCRQSHYCLSPAGMLYPGAAPDVQSYLFRTICQPTLCYGTECMNISHRDVAQLDSTQGQLIKRSLGLSKRSYNTELFQAMNIKRASDLVSQNACSLFGRICFCL